MQRLKLMLIAAVALVAASCSDKTSISEQVASAEMAMAENDVDASRRIADELLDHNRAKGNFTASDMARLSILYMQLDERSNDPDAVQLAVRCYKEAFEANADSARLYYSRLPVEDEKYYVALNNIVETMENPSDLSVEREDSTNEETYHEP